MGPSHIPRTGRQTFLRLWRRIPQPDPQPWHRRLCDHAAVSTVRQGHRVSAKLTDAKGNPVEFFLSDPEHPATSFGQFGVICLIPKQSLQPQHTYSMRIDATWKGKLGTWKWSFLTVSPRAIEASDDRAVASAINVASLVHGTVAYGGMRNSETAFLRSRRAKGAVTRCCQ